MRHPILFAVWLATFAIFLGGLAAKSDVLLFAFLVSPFAAIATFAVTNRRSTEEPLRKRFRILYLIVLGGIAAFSLLGIVGSASSFSDVPRNAPLAIFFLMTLVASWAAIARQTPRRAALPGMVAHVSWVPLIIINIANETLEWSRWQQMLAGLGVMVILILGAFASLLALYAFVGPARLAPATVRD